MTVEVQPYFAVGERYPALIGVRAEGDEYETAYVSKSELVDALAENAKLCQQLADVTESVGRMEERCAKLRELAQQMYPPAKAHLQLGVTLGCNDTLSYDWALQMAELGIEVPE